MSADLLRRAAAQIRERAEAASPSPWFTEPNTHAGRVWVAMTRKLWPKADAEPIFQVRHESNYRQREHDAAHIASWHPAVALAVADWLDREDDEWKRHYDEWWSMHLRAWDRANNGAMPDKTREHFQRTATEYADGQHRPALAVARAYLGEA